MQYYAGLDLGGTFVKGGIVDDKGNIVAKDKIPTGKDRPYTEIARDMGISQVQVSRLESRILKKMRLRAEGG